MWPKKDVHTHTVTHEAWRFLYFIIYSFIRLFIHSVIHSLACLFVYLLTCFGVENTHRRVSELRGAYKGLGLSCARGG